MRIVAVTFFSALLLVPVLSKVWIMADFALRRDFIAQTLCINRNMPDPLMCSGRCYLETKLEEVDKQSPSDYSLNKITQAELVYIPHLYYPVQEGEVTAVEPQKSCFYPPSFFMGYMMSVDIFHPPQLS